MSERNWVNLLKQIVRTTGYSAQELAQELRLESQDLFNVLANVKPANQPTPETAERILNLYKRVQSHQMSLEDN